MLSPRESRQVSYFRPSFTCDIRFTLKRGNRSFFHPPQRPYFIFQSLCCCCNCETNVFSIDFFFFFVAPDVTGLAAQREFTAVVTWQNFWLYSQLDKTAVHGYQHVRESPPVATISIVIRMMNKKYLGKRLLCNLAVYHVKASTLKQIDKRWSAVHKEQTKARFFFCFCSTVLPACISLIQSALSAHPYAEVYFLSLTLKRHPSRFSFSTSALKRTSILL